MTAIRSRIGTELQLDGRRDWLLATAGLLLVVVATVAATRTGYLSTVTAAALAGAVTLVAIRRPLLGLLVFAASIPIESVLVIDGLGTLGRFAGILFAVTYGVPRLGSLKIWAMPPAGWAYMLLASLSLFWAADPGVTWQALPTLLQLFVIAVLVADYVVRDPSIVRPVMWAYSASAALTALIGVRSYLDAGFAGDRASALSGQDPAQFAAVLLPAFVFGLHQVIAGERRALSGLVTLITAAGIAVSGTRGAWVAVGVVMLLFVIPRLPSRQRIAVLAALAVVAVVVYQIPGIADLIAERSGNAVSTGGAGRADIWLAGLTLLRLSPVIGVGFANFPVVYTLDAVRASGATNMTAYLAGRAPHDIFLSTGVELGVLGVVVLGLFIVPLVLRRGWGVDAMSIQAGLAALMVAGVFLDVLSNRKQVWLVIGIAAGLTYLAQRERREALAAGTPIDGSAAPIGGDNAADGRPAGIAPATDRAGRGGRADPGRVRADGTRRPAERGDPSSVRNARSGTNDRDAPAPGTAAADGTSPSA